MDETDPKDPYENIVGSWSYELKQHFDSFSEYCWEGLNRCCEQMREEGHENKVEKMAWREYVIWDMWQKHQREKAEGNENDSSAYS